MTPLPALRPVAVVAEPKPAASLIVVAPSGRLKLRVKPRVCKTGARTQSPSGVRAQPELDRITIPSRQ